MRILIAADTYAPDVNGASTFAQRLAAGLTARHEVHVVAPARGPRSTRATVAGIVEHRLRAVPVVVGGTGLRFCPPVGLARAATRVLREVRPDVVHVQSHFLVGRALVGAANRLGIPVVATNHFMPENLTHHVPVGVRVRAALHGWAWADAAAVFTRADVVTAPTPYAAALAERAGIPGPVLPISCGMDLHRFAPDPSGALRAGFRARHGIPDRPTIGYVGRLAPEKNVSELVEALALVRRVRPELDAQLLLVGDGAQRAGLLRRAAELGVADRVVSTGFVPEADLPAAYLACDAFANAGTAELQSLVVLEAMASGLPVLGVDACALPHLVRDGENGFLFPHARPDALAARLALVLGEPALAARMGARSLELAAEHDESRTLARFEELYALRRTARTTARSLQVTVSAPSGDRV
ncbi:glycosyltransferase involved in cell wall biosynthesis [Kineococcus radiotolerans]|uniref:Glycosyltransferase involved in cell wall biosynthesis n=1 Tax=Kineococcus radiotolerans TaxID=131568 RepID=A0A7W4XX37_KINRA|nr:glycosyltransferase [Kineococcus radiotolerans]MBB2900814.1 glycosyltransferase involved in cell wall biosynthesis [Kineococcus radiotolerans]